MSNCPYLSTCHPLGTENYTCNHDTDVNYCGIFRDMFKNEQKNNFSATAKEKVKNVFSHLFH